MYFDVRTAALGDLSEHHVRLAVSLLGAHRLQARLTPWDGTRCDLLIALADDAYGAQALKLARRRGTAMIALGRNNQALGVDLVDPDATALALSQRIREVLQSLKEGKPADAAPGAVVQVKAEPYIAGTQQEMFCKVAMPPLRGKPIDALCSGIALRLRPQEGRVYALTLADLMYAAELPPESDGRILVVDGKASNKGWVSASLESMALRLAHRMGTQLPAFPEGCYRLDTWPDAGALPLQVSGLRVARLLFGNTRSVSELQATASAQVTPTEINVCLWAFAASDLLRMLDAAQPAATVSPHPPRVQEGLLAGLARRFGLWRGN